MDFFVNIYHIFLYRPLVNCLVLLYEYLPGHDFGIAVVLLTILVKIILFPLGMKSLRSQQALSKLQPEIKKIQEKYKDNKEEQTKALMELYKKYQINPFSGCLPLIIQFPILVALYQVFRHFSELTQGNLLYSFVPNPGQINPVFLGILDLSKPSLMLAFLAGILQFFQSRMALSQSFIKESAKSKNKLSTQMQKQMVYFLPFFTVLILFRLPSVIGLYWVVVTIFTIVQQYYISKKLK